MANRMGKGGSSDGILQARILEWVAFPFSRGSSQPKDLTQVSQVAGRFFTSWATREAQEYWSGYPIPSPVDLPKPGIELGSPALAGGFFTASATWEAHEGERESRSVVSDSLHPMDCSTPAFPVHHQLLELTQTHVHWVSDAIQPSHPLSSPILPPSMFPSIWVFSHESAVCNRWPKYFSRSLSFKGWWRGPVAYLLCRVRELENLGSRHKFIHIMIGEKTL